MFLLYTVAAEDQSTRQGDLWESDSYVLIECERGPCATMAAEEDKLKARDDQLSNAQSY